VLFERSRRSNSRLNAPLLKREKHPFWGVFVKNCCVFACQKNQFLRFFPGLIETRRDKSWIFTCSGQKVEDFLLVRLLLTRKKGENSNFSTKPVRRSQENPVLIPIFTKKIERASKKGGARRVCKDFRLVLRIFTERRGENVKVLSSLHWQLLF